MEAGSVNQFAVAGIAYQSGRDMIVHEAPRVAWPVRVGAPPPAARHHRDRDVVLEPGRDVVLTGLGGVGKTQVAARFAASVWTDSSVDLAVWVTAVSRDAVVTAFAEAARRVSCCRDDCPPDDAAEAFRAWLVSCGLRWVVVLDDVRDPHDLRGLRPPSSGWTVITTRRRDRALGQAIVELDVFSVEEAVAYLASALPSHAHEELAGLAEDLGRLPLALAHAAAFIADKPLLSVAGYRKRLADRCRTLADVMPSGTEPVDDRVGAVAATWSLSIDLADGLPPRGLARPVLDLASLLDPAGVPVSVFEQATGLEVDDVHDALACLHRLSLVTLDPDRPARAVAVHALVQRAVRDTFTPAKTSELAHVAARALTDLWPATFDPESAQAFRSAALALHANTTPALREPDLHVVLFLVGRSLADAGQSAAAVTYFRALHAEADTHLGADHRDTLTARHNLAAALGELGRPAEAVAEYERLLADRLRVLGPDHPDVLPTRNNLALWRGESGDAAGAADEFAAMIADSTRILGPHHSGTLTARHNLAYWRGEAGEHTGAIAEFRALLADQVALLGPDHPDCLTTRHNIATWLDWVGDSAQAIAEYEALAADQCRVLGANHPDLLLNRHNLAAARVVLGGAADVLGQFEALAADCLEALGADHPLTLTVHGGLANCRGHAGDHEGAARLFAESAADRTRVLGADHPSTLVSRSNSAYWRGKSGDAAGASTAYEALLPDCLRLLGPDHHHTLSVRHNVARWRGEAGDASGALAGFTTLLPDRVRVLGPDHPQTLTNRHEIARWTDASGDVPGAVALLETLLADRNRVLGPDHPDTALTLRDLDRLDGPAPAP
ncbi:tetratricopeptide repeat protein [Saccharothrix violaceirubra]|uniref:Tetratricopeptide (TPR) repeat protein n=1 Tax=Saccharothrix violaceirubra TaxID=413306 RepID=A0A7W7T4K5_9PSEU|nr:tetratricopeptide repeat protein [Saccharothrix violaceirubra]MBB4966463.1 tetratricopeptide (TPR) repeat protein [Saccharothrix violaceirubra]